MVDINIFIIHYVLTTVLDRLDVENNFFFFLCYNYYISRLDIIFWWIKLHSLWI